MDTITSDSPSPDDTIESQETESAVREAVAMLPPAEREVVLLFYMAGQSQDEIARALDITANAVKTRLYSGASSAAESSAGDAIGIENAIGKPKPRKRRVSIMPRY